MLIHRSTPEPRGGGCINACKNGTRHGSTQTGGGSPFTLDLARLLSERGFGGFLGGGGGGGQCCFEVNGIPI